MNEECIQNWSQKTDATRHLVRPINTWDDKIKVYFKERKYEVMG
jgi:hypothetical protein